MAAWTKAKHKEFERTIISEYRRKLAELRGCGGVHDALEECEPASLPKIALVLMGEQCGLSQWTKTEIKNLRWKLDKEDFEGGVFKAQGSAVVNA